jgi:hypothetical protein
VTSRTMIASWAISQIAMTASAGNAHHNAVINP